MQIATMKFNNAEGTSVIFTTDTGVTISTPYGSDSCHWDEIQLFPVDQIGAYVAPAPVVSSEVVSMRQARLALLKAGLLTQVNAAIETMTGMEGEAARIEWEYATEVSRTSTLVASMMATLSLSDIQLDQLFTEASKL